MDWLRDTVEKGHIAPQYLHTDEMIADALTKALARAKVEDFRRKMGLMEWQPGGIKGEC